MPLAGSLVMKGLAVKTGTKIVAVEKTAGQIEKVVIIEAFFTIKE